MLDRRSPHIALLTTTLDVSGAEKVMALLAEGLADAGFRVSIVGLQRRSGALAHLVRRNDIEVLDLGLAGAWDLGVLVRLRRFLRDEQVSVLYTFLYHAHVLGRLVGRFADVRHIVSSEQVADWGTPTARALDKWTARWCERVIAVSEGVKTDVVQRMKVEESRVRVIYNAIDVHHYRASRSPFDRGDSAPVVLGSASRLAAEKNHESLLRGFAIARRNDPRLKLRLAGGGPLAGRIAALVMDFGLGDAVTLLGHVEDVRSFYDDIDVFVQPSRTEGLPCAVIEAMAMERPVIATDVPGNRDAVVHNTTGWLIEPDSDVAWAQHITSVSRDPARARCFGQAGRRRAEQLFDAQPMVANTIALFGELGVAPA
jgi:glycosyltransferase involved in cell wall biosynthesis